MTLNNTNPEAAPRTERIKSVSRFLAMQPGQRLYTSAELAEALRIHPGAVRRLHRDGIIKALRFGPRTFRYDFRSVIEDLRRHMGDKP